MGRAIWSGAISFGLVAIPVKLFTAVRAGGGDVHFHFLHDEDKGQIHNERVCSVCGKKVAWQDVARGYEYAKGRFVVLSDEELSKATQQLSRSIDIVQFVQDGEIDPVFFDTPYYLAPDKAGRHAYALLRSTLADAHKVGIARVVLRTKEHLAALKPSGDALVLDLLHWSDEIVDKGELEYPQADAVPDRERKAATMLIDTMTAPFDPSAFHDVRKEELRRIIEQRVAGEPIPEAEPIPATNVANLLDALQRSLERKQGTGDEGPEPTSSTPRRGGAKGAKAAHRGRRTTRAA